MINNGICWKHDRVLYSNGICSECNDKPPKKPEAFSDSIKKAAIALSYAFRYKNEAERMARAEYWEDFLRHEIVMKNYEIIEVLE